MIDPEAILSAMDARVRNLPDGGEGSAWHYASENAWQIRDDYRRAIERDRSMLHEWDENWMFDKIAAACLRDAQRIHPST